MASRVRLTLYCGDHTVSIQAVAWTKNGNDLPGSPHFDDPQGTQFACVPGGSTSREFELPQEPNDLEIIYVSDDGPQTPYKISTERFEFGKRYILPSPSPGTPTEPPEEDPPGDAEIEFTPILPGKVDFTSDLLKRFQLLEKTLLKFHFPAVTSILGIPFATFTRFPTGPKPAIIGQQDQGQTEITGTIKKPGPNNQQIECEVKITITVDYSPVGELMRTGTNPDTFCQNYTIKTTILVEEKCPGDASFKKVGESTHTSQKKYCTGDDDTLKRGETTSFDGTKTETATYDHGTKVTVKSKDGKMTITIVYPDGTSDTLTLPK